MTLLRAAPKINEDTDEEEEAPIRIPWYANPNHQPTPAMEEMNQAGHLSTRSSAPVSLQTP